MLTPEILFDYQKKAVNFQCVHPHSMLWLDMGLGKTVITLTAMAHLIRTAFLRGVIIVAPIRVIRLVWRQEAAKWNHTSHLKFSMVTGTKDQRTRALLRLADEGAEVAHAVLRQRCAASLQLGQQLRLVLVDPRALALVVGSAAGREAVLRSVVVPLAAAQDDLLLLQLAAAVAVQRRNLSQVALNLASQEAGVQRSLGGSVICG